MIFLFLLLSVFAWDPTVNNLVLPGDKEEIALSVALGRVKVTQQALDFNSTTTMPPFVTWDVDSPNLFSLLFVSLQGRRVAASPWDSLGAEQALGFIINIPGNKMAMGEVVLPYSAPILEDFDEVTVIVLLLRQQNELHFRNLDPLPFSTKDFLQKNMDLQVVGATTFDLIK